jgi:hypothetical protein
VFLERGRQFVGTAGSLRLVDISPMDSDSTLVNAVDAETNPVGWVDQGISLSRNDSEQPRGVTFVAGGSTARTSNASITDRTGIRAEIAVIGTRRSSNPRSRRSIPGITVWHDGSSIQSGYSQGGYLENTRPGSFGSVFFNRKQKPWLPLSVTRPSIFWPSSRVKMRLST